MTYLLPHIEKMSHYPSGEQPKEENTLRLNLNENPFPPSNNILRAIQSIDVNSLRLYPDQHCHELRAALANHYNVEKNQIFCGNGSSEIISLLFRVFVGAHGRIAIPEPSFSLYDTMASIYQANCIKVPTHSDLTIDINLLMKSDTQMIILANPNAPSGILLNSGEIERLVSRFQGLVVVDEAYIDFAKTSSSAISLINRYENVIVLRTFSKVYSLCGIRVGYCFANNRLIAAIEKGKNLYHVNTLSQQLAIAALKDQDYLTDTIKEIRRVRDSFAENLVNLGFTVIPSDTNFLLCTPPQLNTIEAKELYNILKKKNIYVRYFAQPRLHDKLRISIGTENQMDKLYAELFDIYMR